MNFKQALALLELRGHGNKKNNLTEVKKTAALLGLQDLPYKTVHLIRCRKMHRLQSWRMLRKKL